MTLELQHKQSSLSSPRLLSYITNQAYSCYSLEACQTIYVIKGYGGLSDGGFLRVDNGTIRSVVWFECCVDAERFLDYNEHTFDLPFMVVATTARELREVHGYEYWSKGDWDTVAGPVRIE